MAERTNPTLNVQKKNRHPEGGKQIKATTRCTLATRRRDGQATCIHKKRKELFRVTSSEKAGRQQGRGQAPSSCRELREGLACRLRKNKSRYDISKKMASGGTAPGSWGVTSEEGTAGVKKVKKSELPAMDSREQWKQSSLVA